MRKTKQVLVIRKDLKMPKGKLAAQVAHASLNTFLEMAKFDGDEITMQLPKPCAEWLRGIYTKICLGVNSEEELLAIHQKAKEAGLLTTVVKDIGLTWFTEPTYTVVGIGPDYADRIDPITGACVVF